MKKNLVKILSLGAVLGIALTACDVEAKDERYLAADDFTVAYKLGNAVDLITYNVFEGLNTEGDVYREIVQVYTTNRYGNFGAMVLNGEKSVTAKYKDKEITPCYVCKSNQSYFEKVESGYVDPVSERCFYTRDKNGNVKFYTSFITEQSTYEYDDFVWGATGYSYSDDVTHVSKTRVTDESIKIENGVMTAVFSVKFTKDNVDLLDCTYTTTWNLDK